MDDILEPSTEETAYTESSRVLFLKTRLPPLGWRGTTHNLQICL